MPKNIIVLGASAGGLESLRYLVGKLPADFNAAVVVLLHMQRQTPSMLPEILRTHATLPVAAAFSPTPLQHGTVYVACPNHNLVIHEEVLKQVPIRRFCPPRRRRCTSRRSS